MNHAHARTLAVLAPLRVEARALRKAVSSARVVRTGMGPRRSRRSARILRGSGDAALAVAGLCGALDPALAPGDVVVASELEGAGRRRACPGADQLMAELRRRGIMARIGTIHCVDHVARKRERDGLRESGAIAMDMESLWLAEAARDRPFAVLRVVVDAPGHELFRLGLISSARRALRALRRAAPALEGWSAELGGS